MTLPRFFVPGSIDPGREIQLPESAAHHLVRVLRLEAGSHVSLFNGTGGEYVCEVTRVAGKTAAVRADEFIDDNRAATIRIHLGMCILKKDPMNRVIARAVELGVARITPLVSERCTVSKKIIYQRVSHWRDIVIASCEQCGLNLPPDLPEAIPLHDWLASQDGVKLMMQPSASPLADRPEGADNISLLAGPEGGFTDAELQAAAGNGFEAVTFGSRILRAETAPLVAMSVLQRLWGDYRAC